jgi:MinD-like ATPase involved in chromosome partitioning or flagellar assembly
MALANVGLELARIGRRVLLVDFDLEAPGLDTFPILRPKVPTKGVVDFVTQYYTSELSPDVSDFVYEVEVARPATGSIFVMPTGLPDEEYGNRLNSIDWQELYAERDGFLLFEDLKEQWKRALQPDYVLIDSRTGHTDVGGICTRQLPDAVALLFFPNEQNQRGLKTVVEDIRAEKIRSGRDIALYFVASNVPEIDDEDRILSKRLHHFSKSLKFGLLNTIHRYDSLALLDQKVFTVERPRSKLANEYRRLTQRITSNNYTDRGVAMRILDQLTRRPYFSMSPKVIDESLRNIRALYTEDGEILYNLAMANRSLGRDSAAALLTKEAQERGYETEETLVAKAIPAYEAKQVELARKLIQRALEMPRGRFFTREQVVKAVVRNDPDYLPTLVENILRSDLDAETQVHIATQMTSSIEGAHAAEALLRPIMADDSGEVNFGLVRNNIVLCLMAQGKFKDAMRLITEDRNQLAQRDVADNFNYAMAEWAESGAIPADLFSRVIDQQQGKRPGANSSQCLAVAFWANHDRESARKEVQSAKEQMDETEPTFSCWRYLQVDAESFRQDLSELLVLINTDKGLPTFISRTRE